MPFQISRNRLAPARTEMAPNLHLPAVRPQRNPLFRAVRYELCPIPIELVAAHCAALHHLNVYAAARNHHAVIIAGVTIDLAKRKVQHRHFKPGKRQHQPRAEHQEKSDCYPERNTKDEAEHEHAARVREGIISPRNKHVVGNTARLVAIRQGIFGLGRKHQS